MKTPAQSEQPPTSNKSGPKSITTTNAQSGDSQIEQSVRHGGMEKNGLLDKKTYDAGTPGAAVRKHHHQHSQLPCVKCCRRLTALVGPQNMSHETHERTPKDADDVANDGGHPTSLCLECRGKDIKYTALKQPIMSAIVTEVRKRIDLMLEAVEQEKCGASTTTTAVLDWEDVTYTVNKLLDTRRALAPAQIFAKWLCAVREVRILEKRSEKNGRPLDEELPWWLLVTRDIIDQVPSAGDNKDDKRSSSKPMDEDLDSTTRIVDAEIMKSYFIKQLARHVETVKKNTTDATQLTLELAQVKRAMKTAYGVMVPPGMQFVVMKWLHEFKNQTFERAAGVETKIGGNKPANDEVLSCDQGIAQTMSMLNPRSSTDIAVPSLAVESSSSRRRNTTSPSAEDKKQRTFPTKKAKHNDQEDSLNTAATKDVDEEYSSSVAPFLARRRAAIWNYFEVVDQHAETIIHHQASPNNKNALYAAKCLPCSRRRKDGGWLSCPGHNLRPEQAPEVWSNTIDRLEGHLQEKHSREYDNYKQAKTRSKRTIRPPRHVFDYVDGKRSSCSPLPKRSKIESTDDNHRPEAAISVDTPTMTSTKSGISHPAADFQFDTEAANELFSRWMANRTDVNTTCDLLSAISRASGVDANVVQRKFHNGFADTLFVPNIRVKTEIEEQ